MALDTVLAPPQGKGHHTVVRLPEGWFIACASRELRARPLAAVLQGVPLVLFRDEQGAPRAFLDRCPHRNVPLSEGAVVSGQLRCGYHGWRFAGDGTCVAIPGLHEASQAKAKARRATPYAALEQDGFVWVYAKAETTPKEPPFRFPFQDDGRYHTVRRSFTVRSSLHAALENTLDVPHTAFLHAGLFRTGDGRGEVEVQIRRLPRGVEAEFIGEKRPPGLAGKLLAPGGGVVQHFDRFLLPSVAQVEYRLGARSHLLVTSAMTPLQDFETAVHAVVTFRLPLPSWLVKAVLTPVALRIFGQDARILALQTGTIERFGGEQYASTEIDVLGPRILRLLKESERGEVSAPVAADEQRVMLQV